MPRRKSLLVKGEVYHVFNRSVARQPIFLNRRDYQRALETVDFYRLQKLPVKLSRFKQLPEEEKKRLLENSQPQIDIIAFCFMPNHVHFLLRAIEDKSISQFMNNFQHSYAKYFNTKNDRTGSLFQSMFKAVRIETDEQLLHVSRYIHLNPVSAFLVEIDSLQNYPWSSFKDYINPGDSIVEVDQILGHFKSKEEYKKFVFDQSDYQRELEQIKHLALE